jgi:predicted AlkP superfamily pyrophosphatase or phosphodiesterase
MANSCKIRVTFVSLFFLLFLIKSNAQSSSKPKLVVGIVVDQMRYDYIYKYWNTFGDKGFKRLVNEGFFCRNTNFNYVPTYTAPGHASIYTGATPAMHGIIGNNWFDRKSKNSIYCTQDNTYKTVGSSTSAGQMSPHYMLSNSICDELRLSNNMKSRVIGIALKDRGAILPAGHLANAAYWFDGYTGNWISSTFYLNNLPEWVNVFNKQLLPKKYLAQPWNLLLAADKYSQSMADDTKYERSFNTELKPVFPHNLPLLMKDNGGLSLIKATPFGNSFTKDFAIETIKSEKLGQGAATDFLTVSFSSTDYVGHQFGPASLEMQDTYLRLDQDIAELLAFLDEYNGKNQTLVFLTADHAGVENPAYLGDEDMPSGYFDSEHPIDSLKKYLSNKYGDTLVLDYSNEQIFLNRIQIEEKKLQLDAVQEDVANFMLRFRGVANSTTSSILNRTEFTKGIRKFIQNGYNQKRSGDVMLNYDPSWIEFSRTGTTHGSPYPYDTHVPLIFYGWNVKQGSSSSPIDITDIAPTLAQMLNIQFPNGNMGKPIVELVK